MEVNSQRPVLKRTDTQAISQISPITNKFDQPQENAKQIKWDSDEEDTKKMPPPPPPSPVMPSVSPPPPPNEKSFIKNLKKRNNESKEPLETEPSLKFLRKSENIGPFECPDPGCNYTATQSGSIRSHMKRRHSSVRAFACTLCSYTAKTDADLKKHTGRHAAGMSTPNYSTTI